MKEFNLRTRVLIFILVISVLFLLWIITTLELDWKYWLLLAIYFGVMLLRPVIGSEKYLPTSSLKALLRFFLILILFALTLEFVVLPWGGEKSMINQPDWVLEDQRIDANVYAEVNSFLTQADWVYRTAYFSISPAKITPMRILVMGDSFVMGDGYSNFNDTWWRQLQRELNRRGYANVEVIGAGVTGASTAQQFENVNYFYNKYNPDLIIWGYVTNDPDEGIVSLGVVNDNVSIYHSNLVKKSILPRINFLLQGLRENKLGITESEFSAVTPYKQWELMLLSGENFELYKNTIHRLAEWIKSKPIPQFFITLPNAPDRKNFETKYNTVAKVFTSEQIPFYDTLDNFVLQYDEESSGWLKWGINPADSHPGPISTTFLARQAADILERDYPSVLGQKVEPIPDCEIKINQARPWDLKINFQSDTEFSLDYPLPNDQMLRMPFGRPYVQFNLDCPAAVQSIHLSGKDISSAELYLTAQDQQPTFESIQVYNAGKQQGNSLTWSLDGYAYREYVTTVRLSVEFRGTDRQIQIKIVTP